MSRVLLVAGGNPSDWPTIEPATYDYFVGIDRGCLHLLEADLPLQLAVGDFDSLSREEYHFVQETAETLIQAPAEKDDTDTLREIFIPGSGSDIPKDSNAFTGSISSWPSAG